MCSHLPICVGVCEWDPYWDFHPFTLSLYLSYNFTFTIRLHFTVLRKEVKRLTDHNQIYSPCEAKRKDNKKFLSNYQFDINHRRYIKLRTKKNRRNYYSTKSFFLCVRSLLRILKISSFCVNDIWTNRMPSKNCHFTIRKIINSVFMLKTQLKMNFNFIRCEANGNDCIWIHYIRIVIILSCVIKVLFFFFFSWANFCYAFSLNFTIIGRTDYHTFAMAFSKCCAFTETRTKDE